MDRAWRSWGQVKVTSTEIWGNGHHRIGQCQLKDQPPSPGSILIQPTQFRESYCTEGESMQSVQMYSHSVPSEHRQQRNRCGTRVSLSPLVGGCKAYVRKMVALREERQNLPNSPFTPTLSSHTPPLLTPLLLWLTCFSSCL